jgi:hypothetical protein
MIVIMIKTLKTSSTRRIVIAFLAATTIVTVVGMAVVVPASSIVKPAYAQLDNISGEQIVGGGEEIPDSDDIREKVGEITSQSVPRLAELGTLFFGTRPPPALAD